MLDDVEKLTWKQVGFFMSGFDIFCQLFCSKNTQNRKSPTIYKAFSLKKIHNFCG